MLIIKYDSFIEKYDHNAINIYLFFTLNQKKGKKRVQQSEIEKIKIILAGKNKKKNI